jgi:hypothetical protein
VTVRLLLWDLGSAGTTLGEVRERLPSLADGDVWISNGAQERLGLISRSGSLPDLEELTALIGDEPVVAEEFDVE